jgi:glycosyltransferase involved in cell wall biosynthesis
MKIVFWHFYTFRLLRGIETLVISLSNALVKKGVDVSIVTAKPTIQSLVLPDERVKVYAYPTFRYYNHLTTVPFYLNHFLHHRYDHIITFFADFGEGLTWRILNRFKEMPLTLYLCYSYSGVPHRYHSFLQLGWEREAKHILADGKWFAKEAETLFQRPVPVVPVGTDSDRFRPDPSLRHQIRRKFGFSDDEVILLNVSALERQKGTWRVVQALARLRDRFPQLHYVILGQGDDEPNLRQLVEELNLQQQIIFAGTTSQLEAYYNLADIFVMLPDAEANSIASHEAMSCALPIIASNTGGFVESIPNQAGFLVNPDQSGDIDIRLEQLIINPQLRLQMGQAGREYILKHLTWDRVAEQFLEFVEQEV